MITQALAQVRHHVTQLSSTDETISIAVEDLHTRNSRVVVMKATHVLRTAHFLQAT